MKRLNQAFSDLQVWPASEPVGQPLSDALFRDAMRRVVTAVHVVTSDGPDGRAGLTASAVASVSDQPPTVLVCLNGSSRSAARLIANGVFCINTLGQGDEEIAATFAGRTDLPHHRRFERGNWHQLVTGSPVLRSALVAFDCRLTDIRRVATHDVVLGEVLSVSTGPDARALAYLDLSVLEEPPAYPFSRHQLQHCSCNDRQTKQSRKKKRPFHCTQLETAIKLRGLFVQSMITA